MSTWTSKAALLLLLLSGCVAPDSAAGPQATTAARQTLSFGGIRIAGPAGFCPLPRTQRLLDDASFVAFAPCDGKLGSILAATVGPEGSASGIALKRSTMGPYFETENGKAALRGAGNNDGISVHEVSEYKGAVVLRLTRVSQGKPSDSWRAVMQVDGRLVTLTVRARQNSTLAASSGTRLVTRFVDAMVGANAAQAKGG
jgi:hypothetical protein